MASNSYPKTEKVTSDAASEVTLQDNASVFSKADTLAGNERGEKPSLLNRLRHPRSSSSSTSTPRVNPIPKKDPYKNWEARYCALRG